MSGGAEGAEAAVGSVAAREPMVVVDHVVQHFSLPRAGLRPRRTVHAVDDVSLSVDEGASLGLVGESGSGKSTLARLVLGMVRPTSGTVTVDGVDTATVRGASRRRLARTVQLVFQDPHAALDPRMTVYQAMAGVLGQHRLGTRVDRRERVLRALAEVGLGPTFLERTAAACSGGQLQRVVIARALLLDPGVLVCDEPTSALDASVQAEVLNLLVRLRREHRLTLVMISHDLRVVRATCDRVAVLYLGQVVEVAQRDDLFEVAKHPYTLALLRASGTGPAAGVPELTGPGEPPSPVSPPPGCRFATRCLLATERCRTEVPTLTFVADGHQVRCHRWREVERLTELAHHERIDR